MIIMRYLHLVYKMDAYGSRLSRSVCFIFKTTERISIKFRSGVYTKSCRTNFIPRRLCEAQIHGTLAISEDNRRSYILTTGPENYMNRLK